MAIGVRIVNVHPDLEARILAMPGVKVGGKAATGEAEPPLLFTSEKEFMAWVVKLARDRGWSVYHTFDSRRSEAGFPDLTCLREVTRWNKSVARARHVAAELKMPGKKPTARQRHWLRLFELHGAETFVWYPWDVQTIREVLL